MFKARLKNIEEILIEQNFCLTELSDSTVNINDRMEPCKLEAMKARISAQLITPKLKKPMSLQFLDTGNSHPPCAGGDSSLNISLLKHAVHKMNYIDNDEVHHHRVDPREHFLDENLEEQCAHKEHNPRPKLNAKSIIESLRLNLSDIESMTANNILKITEIKS